MVANQNADGSTRAYTINPWATGISPGPANESGQTVDFVIDSVVPSNLFTVQPTVSPSGVLTFTPNPALTGTATITLHIHDSGGTANGGVDASATQSFTIEVVVPPPVAVNDSYTSTGNVGINVNVVAEGVLQRGTDDTLFGATITQCGPANTTTTAVSGSTCTTTTSGGGNVVLNTNGTFTYDPPPGFTGADHFFYRLTNSGGTSVGDVTVTVSDMIWFVDNQAAACTTLAAGCGRLANPFSTLAAFQAVNSGAAPNAQPGQTIFIYSGSGPYTQGVTLRDNQLLIGQGAGAGITTISGITLAPLSKPLPATGGARPTLATTAAATNAITLAANNTIRGLDIGDKTGSGIAGTNFGTLTLSEVGITGAGQALNLNTGTANATFSTLTSTSGTNGVALTNVAGSVTSTGSSLTGSTGDELLISGGTSNFSYPGDITNPRPAGRHHHGRGRHRRNLAPSPTPTAPATASASPSNTGPPSASPAASASAPEHPPPSPPPAAAPSTSPARPTHSPPRRAPRSTSPTPPSARAGSRSAASGPTAPRMGSSSTTPEPQGTWSSPAMVMATLMAAAARSRIRPVMAST